MTAALSKIAFNVCLELVKHIHGNKCLNSSGKTAAVDTVCTLFTEQGITQSQRKANGLLLYGSCGADVLHIHPGTVTGFLAEPEEGVNGPSF